MPFRSAEHTEPSAPALPAGEDENTLCVICIGKEATSGFLHGDSVHRCVCKDCATYLKETGRLQCPLCRQGASALVNVF